MISTVDRTQPYVINADEFSNCFDHHDKISLYYYSMDDVLADESDEVIDEIEDVIGFDSLNVFDTQTTVWVRNEPMATDFEVICLHQSYAATKHGITLPPKKPLPVKTPVAKTSSKKVASPREAYEEKQREKEKDKNEQSRSVF